MAISPKRTSGPRRRESVLAHYFNDCPVTRAEPVFGFCGTIVLLAVPLEHYTKPLVGLHRSAAGATGWPKVAAKDSLWNRIEGSRAR
jgi:hypothetical protein